MLTSTYNLFVRSGSQSYFIKAEYVILSWCYKQTGSLVHLLACPHTDDEVQVVHHRWILYELIHAYAHVNYDVLWRNYKSLLGMYTHSVRTQSVI